MPSKQFTKLLCSQTSPVRIRLRFHVEDQRIYLEGLSPLIRRRIFEPLLLWRGKTPKLLIALARNRVLYQEAICIFNQINHFRLGASNYWSMATMPMNAIANIKHLEIEVKGQTPIYLLTHSASFARGIQSLHLNITESGGLEHPESFGEGFIAPFPRLLKLAVTVHLSLLRSHHPAIYEVVTALDNFIGVRSKVWHHCQVDKKSWTWANREVSWVDCGDESCRHPRKALIGSCATVQRVKVGFLADKARRAKATGRNVVRLKLPVKRSRESVETKEESHFGWLAVVRDD